MAFSPTAAQPGRKRSLDRTTTYPEGMRGAIRDESSCDDISISHQFTMTGLAGEWITTEWRHISGLLD